MFFRCRLTFCWLVSNNSAMPDCGIQNVSPQYDTCTGTLRPSAWYRTISACWLFESSMIQNLFL